MMLLRKAGIFLQVQELLMVHQLLVTSYRCVIPLLASCEMSKKDHRFHLYGLQQAWRWCCS